MFARVAINSPLPQLDRLFDYQIPEGLVVEPGVRVIVPFGKTQKEGFVVELSATTDWTGKVSSIAEVISPLPVLTSTIYQLVREVANRQGSSFGDVVSAAVPVRAVRAEKAWLSGHEYAELSVPGPVTALDLAARAARIVEPRDNKWAHELLDLGLSHIASGESAIIAMPDFRDIDALLALAEQRGVSDAVIRYTTDGRTEQYQAFLAAIGAAEAGVARIVVGSRNVLYAPVNAKGIYVWDDGDSSHQDQASPYASTREIALIRQKLSNCRLAFLSHSRSVEVQRLVEIGYLTECSSDFTRPAVSVTDGEFRVDSAAWLAIRDGLKSGPVLVQVAGVGVAKSLYCRGCQTRVLCNRCNGPLWIGSDNQAKCRWCNAFALDANCQDCGKSEFRYGKAGATRTAAEFGKSFPGVKIVEVTAADRNVLVDAKPQIVVATPGVEPSASNGYAAVVILDARDALARDTLRATEDAVRTWANAISKLSRTGRVVLVGVSGELTTDLPLWSLREIASKELAERTELRFPPALRVLSALGNKENIEITRERLNQAGAEVIGVTPADQGEFKLLARFSYGHGEAIAKLVRELSLEFASGQKRYSAKSGRSMRPVTFKLDDPQVL